MRSTVVATHSLRTPALNDLIHFILIFFRFVFGPKVLIPISLCIVKSTRLIKLLELDLLDFDLVVN